MTLPLINQAGMKATTGRRVKEDSTVVNIADLLEAVAGNTDPGVAGLKVEFGTPATGSELPAGAAGVVGELSALRIAVADLAEDVADLTEDIADISTNTDPGTDGLKVDFGTSPTGESLSAGATGLRGVLGDILAAVQTAPTDTSGTQVGDDAALAFAHEAGADTQKTASIAVPAIVAEAYKLAVHNPSAVTALTVKLFTVEATLGDCLSETFVVPAAATVTGTAISAHEFLVGGIFCGGALKLVVSNNTVLGAADGFTTTLRLREV